MNKTLRVRITFYSGQSKWGRKTSTGAISKHLATCAVDPRIIPYGSTVEIPSLDWKLKAVDTGPAVVSKAAGKGKVPVVDIFVNTQSDISHYNARTPDYVTVHVKKS